MSPSAPLTFEPVGHAYHKVFRTPTKNAPADDGPSMTHAKDFQRKKEIGDAKLTDYYGLLGISDKGFGASVEDIKQAYKVASLWFHPDKLTSTKLSPQLIEARYKAIQFAYDTLKDPKRRLKYDSSVDFDDSIPDFCVGDGEDFYEVFSEAFQRWGRYHRKKKLPTLGDENTPIAEVEKFYKFWFAFKSWRDFSFMGEHNTDDAENREERRWMIKENGAVSKGAKKKEQAKITKLVQASHVADPRIRKKKEAEEAEREKIKLARRAIAEEKKNAAAEAAEAAAAIKRKEEEAKKEEIRAKQRLKTQHQASKKKFLSSWQQPAYKQLLMPVDSDLLLRSCTTDELNRLAKAMKEKMDGPKFMEMVEAVRADIKERKSKNRSN